MILVCSDIHPQHLVCVRMGCPKGYMPRKRSVVLAIENIDNIQIKLEYKSGLPVGPPSAQWVDSRIEGRSNLRPDRRRGAATISSIKGNGVGGCS